VLCAADPQPPPTRRQLSDHTATSFAEHSGVCTERAAVILSRCRPASWPEARYASHITTAHNVSTGVKTLKGSLYERLGGTDGIKAVAQAFEQRAGKDDRIKQKFARTNFERLTKEFVDQLSQDTGGTCSYTGLSMRQSHTNMGVTSGEFDAFVEDFVATLNDFNVGKAEQDELLSDLAPLRDDIVEVDSPDTGTPLPAAFTPAPPL
jgi:hemoglobin